MAKRNNPKIKQAPSSNKVKVAVDPDSYLKQKSVWRFSDFDWDGGWGLATCREKITNIQSHIQDHLSAFETMTWGEVLKASGGRGEGKGNNSHPISVEKFKSEVRERLKDKNITAEELFSLRLDQGTRLYGVRENNCLRIVIFDPNHKDRAKCAYEIK